MAIKTLALTKLRTDGGTQLRVKIEHEYVSNLADVFRDDGKLKSIPPIEVIFDSVDYWVWDGNHRILAAQEAGRDAIRCNVEKGTQRDAILKAAGANQNHGMPRSHLDKRKAVGSLLADPEWVKCTDNWIAETCGVSDYLVKEVRAATATQVPNQEPQKRKGKDGKHYPAKRRKQNIPVPTFIDDEDHHLVADDSDDHQDTSGGAATEIIADSAEPSACDRYEQRLIEWTKRQFQNIDDLSWAHAMGVWAKLADMRIEELESM